MDEAAPAFNVRLRGGLSWTQSDPITSDQASPVDDDDGIVLPRTYEFQTGVVSVAMVAQSDISAATLNIWAWTGADWLLVGSHADNETPKLHVYYLGGFSLWAYQVTGIADDGGGSPSLKVTWA